MRFAVQRVVTRSIMLIVLQFSAIVPAACNYIHVIRRVFQNGNGTGE